MRPLAFSLMLAAAGSAAAQSAPRPDDVRTPDGKVVATIVRVPHDPERHQETSKVFHHVFAPDGRRLTKGPGGDFGHHRGLFIGWNRTRFAGARHDFWHCGGGESQRFAGFDADEAERLGAGWQVARVDWCTADGDVALAESRALRARAIADDVTAVDVLVFLRANNGAVKLAGDPQHAGHQFRALQRFAEKDGPKVRYVRPASAKAHGNDVWTECAWIAAVLPLPDGPVTVLRVEDPRNGEPEAWKPKWSTRDYGRFGATFTHEIADGGHLGVAWTWILALGERDAAWCERAAATQSLAALDRKSSIKR